MSNFKDLIESPHPIYTQNVRLWEFLLNSYEGGLDYTHALIALDQVTSLSPAELQLMVGAENLRSPKQEGNLFPHPKERDEDFKLRVQMSVYYNFCAPVIDIYTNHLFKLPVISKWGNIENEVKQRDDSIDLMGSSVDEYRKEIGEQAQIYGHIYTLVDSPKHNPEIITMKDKIDNKAFPFFTIFRPQDVINWALDGFGRPYWVLVREVHDTNVDPTAFLKDSLKKISFRLWTRTEWILMDSEGAEKERGSHGLNFVPITPTFDRRSKKTRNFFGISTLNDIAFVARDLFNSISELRQLLRDQTFSFLALQGDSGDYSAVEIGTNKGLRYPKDVNVPEYVSPSSENAEVYFKHIDRQVDKIFELAKLPAGSASFEGQSAVQQSGVSKAWDFNQTNSALSMKAANFEDGENKQWQMFAKWEKKEWDGFVQYSREFNIQALVDDLNEAKETLKMGLGGLFATEVKKAIVKKKFPQKPDDEIEKMVAEFSDTSSGETTFRSKVGSLFKKNVIPDGTKQGEENV